MIRQALVIEIEEILNLVFNQNKMSEHYSGYLSLTFDSIQKELIELIEDPLSFVLIHVCNHQINACVLATQNPGLDVLDVMGPYTLSDDFSIQVDLMDALIKLSPIKQLQLNVHASSLYYQKLMSHFEARKSNVEYHLIIERKSLLNRSAKLDINLAKPKQYAKIKEIHNPIFRDMYLSAEQLTHTNSKQILLVLEQTDDIIGYAKILDLGNKIHLEVFALVEHYRNRHLGKSFLESVLIKAFDLFSHDNIQLIVDDHNEKALNLYRSFGFIEHKMMMIYQISISH
jgi:ribosomal protein S18 acetylase RimI-like enzyme